MQPQLNISLSSLLPFKNPYHPIGYALYHEDGRFIGEYKHVKDLRAKCIAEGFNPLQVIVLRAFENKDKEYTSTYLQPESYAFSSTVYETFSEFLVERTAWSWTPSEEPSIIDEDSIRRSNLFKRGIFWFVGFFTIFR